VVTDPSVAIRVLKADNERLQATADRRLEEIGRLAGKVQQLEDSMRGRSTGFEERLRREAEEMVLKAPWNKMPTDPNRQTCGADDGSTVCVLPVGHPIGHKSKSGRVWL